MQCASFVALLKFGASRIGSPGLEWASNLLGALLGLAIGERVSHEIQGRVNLLGVGSLLSAQIWVRLVFTVIVGMLTSVTLGWGVNQVIAEIIRNSDPGVLKPH